MSEQPKCPECEKLAIISKESNKLGSFLDWIFSKYDVVFGKYKKNGTTLLPFEKDIVDILADYFEIDMDKVNEERDILLQWLRDNEDKK
jgi:hypothetical protein